MFPFSASALGASIASKFRRSHLKYGMSQFTPNGPRECARRRKQIDRGHQIPVKVTPRGINDFLGKAWAKRNWS